MSVYTTQNMACNRQRALGWTTKWATSTTFALPVRSPSAQPTVYTTLFVALQPTVFFGLDNTVVHQLNETAFELRYVVNPSTRQVPGQRRREAWPSLLRQPNLLANSVRVGEIIGAVHTVHTTDGQLPIDLAARVECEHGAVTRKTNTGG